jgi:hypothetical protein
MQHRLIRESSLECLFLGDKGCGRRGAALPRAIQILKRDDGRLNASHLGSIILAGGESNCHRRVVGCMTGWIKSKFKQEISV